MNTTNNNSEGQEQMLSLRISKRLLSKVTALSSKLGLTRSELIREILKKELAIK